ncbi:class II aldolase and Adducin N-terminal domain-containing protein [Podospora fimiseda]|uniref:Class II aldolase and Adducin N-terminal domain-containing protein n=1 Tax=Podospora fimiseda TaxID=252190 RepID=A0AAN7BQ31_9PEZI|nr:class II aldolase and Adducin N-terminal domain-containing protein [Podospora fimiseda]
MNEDYDAALRREARKYIYASHILHHHGVLDAYGHISFRHPFKSDIFIMSRNTASALVSSPEDLIQYYIESSRPLDPLKVKESYLERFIHSEIYKQYPQINSVVHSHSETVIPYTVNRVRLRPVLHLAGFLNPKGPPVWDIANCQRKYAVTGAEALEKKDEVDILVKDEFYGRKFAYNFLNGSAVALMRGHGFTTVGETIEEAVFRAIYTEKNARVLTASMAVQDSARATMSFALGADPGILTLNKQEALASNQVIKATIQRPWELWVREVEALPLYRNNV